MCTFGQYNINLFQFDTRQKYDGLKCTHYFQHCINCCITIHHSTKILLLHQSISWPFQNAINIVWMQLPCNKGRLTKWSNVCRFLSLNFSLSHISSWNFLLNLNSPHPNRWYRWTFLFLGVSIALWCITHTSPPPSSPPPKPNSYKCSWV